MDVNKSSRIVTRDFESLPWKPHPTVPGVTSRFQELEVETHPALDAMVARLEAAEWVPWHVHESSCELAYVLEGEGRLHEASEPPGGGDRTPGAGTGAQPGAGGQPGVGDQTPGGGAQPGAGVGGMTPPGAGDQTPGAGDQPTAGDQTPAGGTGAQPRAGDQTPAGGGSSPGDPPMGTGRVLHPLRPGTALFIPVGTYHAVENIGTSALVIFAVHTSPREEEQSNE